MGQAPEEAGESPSIVKRYSATLISSAAEIAVLPPFAGHSVLQHDDLLTPGFFLASLSDGWRPRVVAVDDHTGLAGIVYAKERVLCGFPMRVMHVDLTFGSQLLKSPDEQRAIILVALKKLLASAPAIRGLRLKVRPRSPELAAVRALLASNQFDAHFSRIKEHAALSLPSTFEQLLMSFGATTRHNFRYYRKRFETAGHIYLENLTIDELRSAVCHLAPRCAKLRRPDSTEKLLAMTAAASRPLAVGLKHRNGEWLSVISGVYRPNAAVLMMQFNNDRDFPRDSLSVVLRACLLESLIRLGMKEFIIWEGTGPPLSRYATQIPTLGIYLDSRAYHWRVVRRTLSAIATFVPEQHLKIYRRLAE